MIELRHAGIDAECVRVDSEASLLSALDGPAPQLVLSDVNMPGFDGPRALAIVRERAPAARFVFLTGAIAEDAPLPAADGERKSTRLNSSHYSATSMPPS